MAHTQEQLEVVFPTAGHDYEQDEDTISMLQCAGSIWRSIGFIQP